MGGFPVEKQLAAACMAHPYEASQILGARYPHRPNEIPSREWLRGQFTFTAQELRAYVLEVPQRAREIENRALDNRTSPGPYIWDLGDGFHVGWYDGPPAQVHDVYFHPDIDEAAADFVLAYWGLPRLGGTPVPDRMAATVFETVDRPSALERAGVKIRSFIQKWTGR